MAALDEWIWLEKGRNFQIHPSVYLYFSPQGQRNLKEVTMNKTLVRATAIAVCFAFLLLSFPGLIQAKPRSSKSYFKWFEKPVYFFTEIMTFLPIYTLPGFSPVSDIPVEKTVISKSGSKMKVTGDINRGRPSRED